MHTTHRSALRVALLAIAVLGLSGTGTTPAGAVPPSVPSVNVLIYPSDNNVDAGGSHTEDFGATSPAGRRLFLSAKTRTLKIQSPEFAVSYYSVRCDALRDNGSSILTAPFYSPAGTTNTVRLAVRPLAIPARSGVAITISCNLYSGMSSRQLSWHLTSNLTAGSVVALTDSVTKQTSETDSIDWLGSNYTPDEIPVAPGERMRLYGRVGMWKTAGLPAQISVRLMVGGDDLPTPTAVNVTADGTILGFNIPATASIGSQPRLSVASTTVLDAGSATTPRRTHTTTWGARLEIVPAG